MSESGIGSVVEEIGVIIIVASILVGGFLLLAPCYKQAEEMQALVAQAKARNANQEKENKNKRNEIAKLKENDPLFTERYIREIYGYCKEGELIIQYTEKD